MPPQVVGRHHHLGTQMPSGGVHPITAADAGLHRLTLGVVSETSGLPDPLAEPAKFETSAQTAGLF
jgi:hypothetical protein